MDFSMTSTQLEFYEYGRQLAARYDRNYWLAKVAAREFPQEMWEQIGANGQLGTLVSKENGGSSLGMTEKALLVEGLAREGFPLFLLITGTTIAMPVIDEFGTSGQKRRLLPELCNGTQKVCFAITERDIGANVYNIQTHAKRTGDRFLLQGTKNYTSGAAVCEYVVVVARTTSKEDALHKAHGFTLFLVSLSSPGLRVEPLDSLIPMPLRECNLYFDDVELGPEDVIGEVDMGLQALSQTANMERIVTAAMSVGLGRYMVARAASYGKERVVFDGPIGRYQGVQHPIAAAHAGIEQAHLMTMKAAWQFDHQQAADEAANIAKFTSAEAAMAASDIALQVHGGSGYSLETGVYDIYQVCRLFQTAPVGRERALCFIAERALGLPRSY